MGGEDEMTGAEAIAMQNTCPQHGPYSIVIGQCMKCLKEKMDAADAIKAKIQAERSAAGHAALISSKDGYLSRDELRERVIQNMQLGLPEFRYCINEATNWAVIGAGPSSGDCLKEIRTLKRRGVNIVSCNKTHDWLLENGIVPWGHVLLDGHEWVADYTKRLRRDVRYFVASQCHPEVFARMKGYPVFLWHAGQDFDEGNEPDFVLRERGFGPQPIIGGGTTVGQRIPVIGTALGAARFHMFGVDSSRRGDATHVMPKKELVDPKTRKLAVKWGGKKWIFETNVHMARQHLDFDKFIEDVPGRIAARQLAPNFRMIFYGTGLTPFWAATIGLHVNPEFNDDPAKCGGYVNVVPDAPFQRQLETVTLRPGSADVFAPADAAPTDFGSMFKAFGGAA